MTNIIVAHVNNPPRGYECIRCDRASPLGNPYAFDSENYRELSIGNYRQWLWDNIQLYQECESGVIDTLNVAYAPIKMVEGLKLAPAFKNPTVGQVLSELELIATVARRSSNVAILCWCRGNKNPKIKDKACHCDRIKSCIEKLFL